MEVIFGPLFVGLKKIETEDRHEMGDTSNSTLEQLATAGTCKSKIVSELKVLIANCTTIKTV